MKTIANLKKYLKGIDVDFEKESAGKYVVTSNGIKYNYFSSDKVVDLVVNIHNYIETNGIDAFIKNECRDIIVKEKATQLIDINSIPKTFNDYYFPDFIKNIARRVNTGANILLSGSAGTGKTELVKTLASFAKINLLSVDFSVGTNSQELIGKFIVKNGATEFIYGIIPQAMKNGWWLNFNELDYATPEHLAIMQGVLTGDDLIIAQNENEVIKAHPNFRIFATANTKGRGTDTGYTGTNFLNLAFLDRFSIFDIDYTKEEPNIVNNITQDKELSDMLVKMFKNLRKATSDGKILNAVFSTRRIKEIANSLVAGECLNDAIYYDLVCRYEEHEQSIINEFVNDVFDNATYLKNNWYLGQKHFVAPVAPPIYNTTASTGLN